MGTPGTAAYAGEVMLGDLARNGFQVTGDLQDSDAVIVNTCAFVEGAKTESLEVGSYRRNELMRMLGDCDAAPCIRCPTVHLASAGHP